MLSLGERLKNARESRGWTQDQLADRINVTRYTISNWERDVCEPCFHELQQLSAVFSLNFLADIDENEVNQEEISRKIRLNPCKQPVIEVISGENACNFSEITVDCHVTGVDQQRNAIDFRFIAPFSAEKTDKWLLIAADRKENCSVRCMNSFVTSRFDTVEGRSIRRKLILHRNFDIICIEDEEKLKKNLSYLLQNPRVKGVLFTMPYTTYANQKSIRIHKPEVKRHFLQIANSEWMAVNKQLGPYGLQLYLYLAANADGFNLELSPQHAENDAGIRRTTFYEYMRKLEINGYLVWKHSNVYDFLHHSPSCGRAYTSR